MPDQITIHLREDRRHIQDTDVESVSLVTKKFGKPLNLEMGCSREIAEIAIAKVQDARNDPGLRCPITERRKPLVVDCGRQHIVHLSCLDDCEIKVNRR